jgi:pimeloyl-ACP methyl ester carboxylesterase
MSWSDKVMASLDERATVLNTARGDVQLAREGRGPPVLAIHGGPGGFDQGLAWCQHLRDGGCEVIAPSRPGYLRTPLQSGRTPEDQADLYAAALDTLGIARTAVLGFSSGGPSAVHFAARHPDRITALFLDTAILRPFEPPIGALMRATLESSFFVWLSYQMVTRWPGLMARFMIDGVSDELSKDQRKEAANWINSHPARLHSMQEQFTSIAPQENRKLGWANDQFNERDLAPLPFANVVAPTLIALGTNDAIVPVAHATTAVEKIPNADLVLVEEGHHILSLSGHYGPVARRQLELAQG